MSENLLTFDGSEQFRKKLITRNLKPYKVEGVYSAGDTNINSQYQQSDHNVIDSPDELIQKKVFADILYPLNTFGPEGGYNETITYNGPPLPVKSNSGPYNPSETQLDLVNEFYIDSAFIQNIYGPEGGYQALYVVTDVENNNKIYLPYWDPPSFVYQSYTPYSIILLDFSDAVNPPLQDDSYLAQIGAKNLQDSLKYRAALETLYDINLRINVDGYTQPDAANTALRANAPLSQRNYQVTITDENDSFLSRLEGTYVPASPIPGDYFLDDLKTRYTTSLGQLVNIFAGSSTLVGDIIGPALSRTVTPSQIFLQYTTDGQKSALFGNLSYNRYRPAYRNSVLGGLFGNLLTTGINNIIEGTGTQLPGDFYVGSVVSDPSYIDSPVSQVPINEFGRETGAPVLGPQAMGILYEGNEDNINFGLKARSFTDGGGLTGKLVWTSPKYKDNAGFRVGIGGDPKEIDDDFNLITNDYEASLSTNINFKPGSILDETQRLIDAADKARGIQRLKHVGNAINQVSKVFHDGYKEITKGSKVLTYVDNATGVEVGKEYARVFAKDTPYYTYRDLQKSQGITTSGRKFTYSVLDNTYNLNIAPLKGSESTNIKNDQVKKYMFSIENLAWKGSSKPGFTVDSLPVCERGPNGGRIMWFPPYDLKFSETSIPTFNPTSFLGRPEPIYTYKETKRNGSISWKIIVDHPSVLNLIVNKVFANTTTTEKVNSILDSFFAGCAKYDLYELAIRYNTIPTDVLKSMQDIFSSPNSLTPELAQEAVNNIPASNTSSQNANLATNPTNISFDEFIGKGFYYPYDQPSSSSSNYDGINTTYVNDPEYRNYSQQSIDFLDNTVKPNYDEIKTKLLEKIYDVLQTDPKAIFTISITSNVSYRDSSTIYNSIGSTRLENFKNTFFDLPVAPNKGKLRDYEKNFQWDEQKPTGDYTNTPVSSNPTDTCECGPKETNIKDNYIWTTMACNSVVINSIKLQSNPTEAQKPEQSNPNAQTAQNPNSTPQAIKPIPGEDLQAKIKKNIGKKVLRHLLSECDYFEVVKESNPMFFDSMKEKIKYFNPAFHSMTPEGLNSRLTFLNQCVRPGDTIPTIGADGKPQFNDASNTAFGSPPILVLRIGDFYNTKIVPNNLSLQFEPLIYDMNPEGIGVQPMIANVTLSFDFIGGSGLAGPVERLQNALSFNYFANTEIYDDRAEATEDTSAIDSMIFDRLVPPVTKSDLENEKPNPGGTTIGTILSTYTSGNTITGETSYKTIFDQFIDSTQDYFNTVTNFSTSVVDEFNYGILMMVQNERNYTNGENDNSVKVEIYGKPEDLEKNVAKAFDNIEEDIENDLNVLISTLQYNGYTNKDIRQVKRSFKDFLKDYESNFSTDLFNKTQEIVIKQQDYVQLYRKLNFVQSGYDGKILNTGGLEMYSISGKTLQNPPPADTKTEFDDDYQTICDDTIEFIESLKTATYLQKDSFNKNPSSAEFPYVYSVETDREMSEPNTAKMYLVLSKVFLIDTEKQKFKDAIAKGVENQNAVAKLNELIDELSNLMKTQKEVDKKIMENYTKGDVYPKFEKYTEVTKGKERVFEYVNTNAPNNVEKELKNIYKTVNINNNKDTFLGKVKFS